MIMVDQDPKPNKRTILKDNEQTATRTEIYKVEMQTKRKGKSGKPTQRRKKGKGKVEMQI